MHLSANSLTGTKVVSHKEEPLGTLEDLMIDTSTGVVDYAVLSFGGVLGIDDKLFAIPVSRFRIDTEHERCILDIDKERLENSAGFDKDNWPSAADPEWRTS